MTGLSARRVGRDPLTVLGLPTPPEWMADAACAEVGGDEWFPEKGGSTKDAERICRLCPVTTECLEYALANDVRFGVWGGVPERERRKLARRRVTSHPRWIPDGEVTEIRKLLDSGQPAAVVASRTGRSMRTVERIRAGHDRFQDERRGAA